MVMNYFPHWVDMSNVTTEVRRASVSWAVEQFGIGALNIWELGPQGEPGFWFKDEQQAMIFILRWL
jgi:hypothetical protein